MVAEPTNGYQLVAALFLRLLGIIYLIAFASLAVQIEGLAGSQGILPFSQELAYVESQTGLARYFQLPTLFWLNAGDTALRAAALAGCAASILIILDRLAKPALIAAFVLYLSLYHAGQVFLTFQWDGLLLEAGFLAIFLNPRSRLVVLLFRWLLFRLRFMSGIAKLTMQDPSWSGLTALNHYFEVQPLPTPLAWYAHQLPSWLLKTGTAATLAVEILVPLMMFLPRSWRFAAAWITILWQLLIILTSNHNWFTTGRSGGRCQSVCAPRCWPGPPGRASRARQARLRPLPSRAASCLSAPCSSGNWPPYGAVPARSAPCSTTRRPSAWSTNTTCSRQ